MGLWVAAEEPAAVAAGVFSPPPLKTIACSASMSLEYGGADVEMGKISYILSQ
jgi:hypothetical protein